MRTTRLVILIVSAASVACCLALVQSRMVPLGVPNEWVWLRVRFIPSAIDLFLAGLGILAYCGFAAVGLVALRDRPSRTRERLWVAMLFGASVIAQISAQSGGPLGQGSMKVATLAIHGASGYFEIARSPQMIDPWKFWADYPQWIRGQDALHVGTHPPGLFLVSRALLGLTRSSPTVTRLITSVTPASVDLGFRTFVFDLQPWTQPERAAVTLMAFLTLLACSATVIPLFALARSQLSAEGAWMAATLWPLAPSAILFQPTADTAFPLIATTALALVARGGNLRAMLAGGMLAIGMQLTLAYLPVGLVAGILLASRSDLCLRRRITRILITGVGFLGVSLFFWWISNANSFAIWWLNQKNHARFYVESPRSYLAWIAMNTVELAIAIGLPTAILASLGFARRQAPVLCWVCLSVLIVLNLSGKNLGEVARLWLVFMPTLLVSVGAALTWIKAGPKTLGAILVLIGVQTLWLQSLIQVVFPTS